MGCGESYRLLLTLCGWIGSWEVGGAMRRENFRNEGSRWMIIGSANVCLIFFCCIEVRRIELEIVFVQILGKHG